MVVRRRPPVHCARDFGACLLAHKISKPARELAFICLWKSAVEHVGDDEPQHMIAKEFQPLVAGGAISSRESRNMREGALKQIFVGKFVADRAFKRRSV